MTSNKDKPYSLFLTDNYKNELECSVNEVCTAYSELILEYYKFIKENMKMSKTNLMKFVIIRGLDTITNIFFHLLYSTKNLNLAYYHSQKSFYLYVEFVGQISEDEKTFLQLTSRDATTYVYKKTIFDVHPNFVKTNISFENKLREKLNIVKIYTTIFETYLLKIIHCDDPIDILYVANLFKNVNNIKNTEFVKILETVVDNLYYKINDTSTFLKVNLNILLCSKNVVKQMNNKINSELFEDKLNESYDVFIAWLLSN
jgi:hypothetical protein